MEHNDLPRRTNGAYFEVYMQYSKMTREELLSEYSSLKKQMERIRSEDLSLDLSRGKPCAEQLDLSLGMLSRQRTAEDCHAKDGTDCRNYGLAFGIPEMKALWAEITGVPEEYIIVGGNSSLNMMYDTVTRALLFGVYGSSRPWCREETLKFLCPSPGYDRHFAICESLGIEMIPVEMTESGPSMDEVEALVADDPTIKGIWCVPKYSNPTGVTYSDETVRRLAAMKTAAPDFRIFWDNAYVVHDLSEKGDTLLDIFAEAKKYGNEDRVFYFSSTSKVTFPGSGVAMMAASPNNLSKIKPLLMVQTIGPDKMNQLRHVEFLRDGTGFLSMMKKHAAILSRKFRIVEEGLAPLREKGVAVWTQPKGGYFVSFDAMDGCATRIYEICASLGVTLTKVGATFPYGKDPRDRNLRIAPSYPTDGELSRAIEVFKLAVEVASLEKLLGVKE